MINGGIMFKDRQDAGRRLAERLEHYRNQNPIVLGIARGGVEIGFEVAVYLKCPLSILVTRKLPFPTNPEAGFGAVAEDGNVYMYPGYEDSLPTTTVEHIKQLQVEEIRRRIQILRGGRPLPELVGRTVIIVDDGIAMGSTMRASIRLCRNRKAARIVAAAPVSGARICDELEREVDEVVILDSPWNFRAVAQAYRNWYDVDDAEVLAIMDKYQQVIDNRGDSERPTA